jgi:hypothetical protein
VFKKACAYAKYIRTSSESKYVPYAHISSVPKYLKNLPLGQPHTRQMKQHRISVANCCSKSQCSMDACQQFHVAWISMWCLHGLLLGFMMIRSKECTSYLCMLAALSDCVLQCILTVAEYIKGNEVCETFSLLATGMFIKVLLLSLCW